LPSSSSSATCERFAVPGLQGQESRPAGARIDPGAVSLVAELRGHERQAAEKLEEWKTRVEEHKRLDAAPATRAGMLLTVAEFSGVKGLHH